MALIHHVVKGDGKPPIVLVHGFACAHSDYDAQAAALSRKHMTVAVDLRGHGVTPGTPDECSIERYGADVATLMQALDLPPAIMVGHSMGCRVAIEAALQAPVRTAGIVLLDGSQFSVAMVEVLRDTFASGGFRKMVAGMFTDMFTDKSSVSAKEDVVSRAGRLPEAIGKKLLLDLARYDVTRLESSLGAVRVPVMAIQTTYSNEKRQRSTMKAGQSTPYLEMIRRVQPSARIEIIADTGHFPQIDEPDATSKLLEDFAAKIG